MLADPRTLTVEAIMDRTRYALAGRFADICSIADLLERYETSTG